MLYLERYHGDSAEIVQENLLKAQKNILEYIANETNQAKIKKYINEQMKDAFNEVDEEVVKDIEHIQGTTWDSMGAVMAKGFVTSTLADAFVNYKNISEGVKTRLMNEAKLVQGHTLKDHFKHLSETNARKLNGFIVDGNAKGLGTKEIASNIRNAIGNVQRNQVSTLVRTTLLEALEEAKNESLDFFEDEILGWKYSAVMDTRTSKVCFMNNNIRHKRKEDFKVLPKNHYNCRSMLVPITELSEEMDAESKKRVVQWDGKTVNHRDGTRSTKFKVGEIKEVDRNATAETYFKTFDKEYQIKYMGVKRYNLWKEGKLSFNEAFNATRKSSLPIAKVKEAVVAKPITAESLGIKTLKLPQDKELAKEALETINNLQVRFKRKLNSVIFDVNMSAAGRAGVSGDIEIGVIATQKDKFAKFMSNVEEDLRKKGVTMNNHSYTWMSDVLNHEYFHTMWQSSDTIYGRAFASTASKFGIKESDIAKNKDAASWFDSLIERQTNFEKELKIIRRNYNATNKKQLDNLRKGKITNEEYLQYLRDNYISEYAQTNLDEFGAEAFSGYVGKKYPTQWENAVGKLVEKYLIFEE